MTIETVTFKLGSYLFGIPIFLTKEVNHISSVVKVPGSSEMFLGLSNLRGQVVTILNPGYWFSVLEKDYIDSSGSMELLIFKSREDVEKSVVHESLADFPLSKDLLAIPVTSMGEIFDMDEKNIKPVPATFGEIQVEILDGIVCQKEETIYFFNFKAWLEIILSKQ